MLGWSPVGVDYFFPLCHVFCAGIFTECLPCSLSSLQPPELCLRCDTICHFTLAKPHQQIVQRAGPDVGCSKKKQKTKLAEVEIGKSVDCGFKA